MKINTCAARDVYEPREQGSGGNRAGPAGLLDGFVEVGAHVFVRRVLLDGLGWMAFPHGVSLGCFHKVDTIAMVDGKIERLHRFKRIGREDSLNRRPILAIMYALLHSYTCFALLPKAICSATVTTSLKNEGTTASGSTTVDGREGSEKTRRQNISHVGRVNEDSTRYR